MFTTIMYGFINEVTRQPGGARIPLRAKHDGRREHSVVRPRRKVQPPAATTAQRGQVAGKYLVLADSFKRAAGFY
jgi:hypothetical protein